VITDAGITTDAEQRHALLLAKLRADMAYVASEQFAISHPDCHPGDVAIQVMCALEPTAEMLALSGVQLKTSTKLSIPVRFEVFPRR
jgi:hypothetical protein